MRRSKVPNLTRNLRALVVLHVQFVKKGRPFFFALDAGSDETNIVYAFINWDVTFTSIGNGNWSVPFTLFEALGGETHVLCLI